MNRTEVTQILIEFGYKVDSVNKLLQNRIKPPADKMFKLEDDYKLPAHAWRDMNSYVNGTKINDTKSNPKKTKKVA